MGVVNMIKCNLLVDQRIFVFIKGRIINGLIKGKVKSCALWGIVRVTLGR